MYRRKEVEAITTIPARRIQFYTESGLLSMDEENPGKGRERLYSRKNMVELFLIRAMSDARIELARIKQVMTEIRSAVNLANLDGDAVPSYIFVQSLRDGSMRVFVSKDTFDGKKLQPAGGVFIIDFAEIVEKMNNI